MNIYKKNKAQCSFYCYLAYSILNSLFFLNKSSILCSSTKTVVLIHCRSYKSFLLLLRSNKSSFFFLNCEFFNLISIIMAARIVFNSTQIKDMSSHEILPHSNLFKKKIDSPYVLACGFLDFNQCKTVYIAQCKKEVIHSENLATSNVIPMNLYQGKLFLASEEVQKYYFIGSSGKFNLHFVASF